MASIERIRGLQFFVVVVAALVAAAFALLAPTASARPSVDDATAAYVKEAVPALKRFARVADGLDAAIAKSAKRSDRTNASTFAGLAKRIKAAEAELGGIEPPNQFAKPHEAYVKAVTRLGSDVDLVARAARKKDEAAATKAGLRLGRTVKALDKADKALGLALQRVAAPGDAASL